MSTPGEHETFVALARPDEGERGPADEGESPASGPATVDRGPGLVERYLITDAARGPWDPASAHGGPPAALLTEAVERVAGEGVAVNSLAFTFLGPVPLGPVVLRAWLIRPGRRQRVAVAEIEAGGRVAMRVRAVLLRRGSVDLPAGVGEPWPELPPPEGVRDAAQWAWLEPGAVAFHPTGMEVRPLEGGFDAVGERASAWLRLRLPVLEGRVPSGAQRAAAAADFGNGLAHPVPFGDYLFVNCDLTLALHRDPAGEWIGVSSRTELDRAGTGVTTTELHDAAGRCGTATQTLFVDRA